MVLNSFRVLVAILAAKCLRSPTTDPCTETHKISVNKICVCVCGGGVSKRNSAVFYNWCWRYYQAAVLKIKLKML